MKASWARCLSLESRTWIVVAAASSSSTVSRRDFRLGLKLRDDGTLRIEVTDARGDRVPCIKDPEDSEAETGRGLRIVAAYAHRWGVDEAPAHAKTVWAELAPGRGET